MGFRAQKGMIYQKKISHKNRNILFKPFIIPKNIFDEHFVKFLNEFIQNSAIRHFRQSHRKKVPPRWRQKFLQDQQK